MPDTLLKHGQGDKRKASKDEFNRHKQGWGLADTGFPGGMCSSPHKFNVSGRLLQWSRTLLLDRHVWILSLILPLVLYFWARWFFLFSPSFFVWNKGDEGTMGISQVFSVCVSCLGSEVCALCWNERYFFGQTVVMGVLFGLRSHGSLFWWFTNKICSGLDLGKCRLSPWFRLSSALPACNPVPAHGSGKVNMLAESMHQGFTVTSGDRLF